MKSPETNRSVSSDEQQQQKPSERTTLARNLQCFILYFKSNQSSVLQDSHIMRLCTNGKETKEKLLTADTEDQPRQFSKILRDLRKTSIFINY